MSDIPKELRRQLDETAVVSIPRVLKQRVSKDGTRKFLMELEDRKRIETVVIPQGEGRGSRYSLCISTQVGCPISCAFVLQGHPVITAICNPMKWWGNFKFTPGA